VDNIKKLMTDNIALKRIIIAILIIICAGVSYFLFKDQIHFKCHSLRYSKEIQDAKKCITLLVKGEEENEIIFIEFEYEADHEQFFYVGLKFLTYPEKLLLYSIMLG